MMVPVFRVLPFTSIWLENQKLGRGGVMANRSYLYSADDLVLAGANQKPRVVGVAEWNYDIPVAFRLLLSAYPRKCRSVIWDVPDEIAIASDYEQGVARLLHYLDRIKDPQIAELRDEAQAFLTAAENKRRYFILECGEIFELGSEPLAVQNERLLSELLELESDFPSPTAADDVDSLGLGNWSNFLWATSARVGGASSDKPGNPVAARPAQWSNNSRLPAAAS
jgi:hypothetical protein